VDRMGTALELGTIAALGAHNVTVNHVVPPPLDDLVSLAGAVALTAGARRNGFSWGELGMDPDAVPEGILMGTVAAALSVASVAALARHPYTRRFFHDERVLEVGYLGALYQSAVRIPVATALVEEVLFRGVLEATMSRRRSPGVAVAVSSLLFGFWHVLPTLRTFEGNPASVDVTKGGAWKAVAATVAATSAAGALLLWLRRRSNSIVAPVVTHAALNVSAYLLARSVTKAANGAET
jgi:uncharacterized protein